MSREQRLSGKPSRLFMTVSRDWALGEGIEPMWAVQLTGNKVHFPQGKSLQGGEKGSRVFPEK